MNKPYTIGVDLGGTNLRVALVARDGRIVERIKVPTCKEIINNLIDSIGRLFSDDVHGIGLAIAGVIDVDNKSITSCPNLRLLEDIRMGELIGNRFKVPVFLENDAYVATLGESVAGVGRQFDSFVLLTLGTGIGGGVIYNRAPLKIASELGHVIVEMGGRRCGCGSFGCLEAYASARAMVELVTEGINGGRDSLMSRHITGGAIQPADIYQYALEGDDFAIEVLKTAGRYLGSGIAGFINIFSPDAVILTGGLTGAWDIYVQEAIGVASESSFRELYAKTQIVRSFLGDDAGLIGAAALAFG
ncbi:MAG: ROK family protein [Magnetococcales bacterium]|uniref:ROK family protein n=1 Tax=Candidatus Magnetobacterium casense TaxID=1455061 RepID=A0ABS6S2P5_9BACT|nr:ROK family protein [Candidatus Magnetobacterium casensis]MBF0608325.1 ROK family protein [Nitrospirota bacterium]MBV6343109.1 ROK family protein [Candidatus Magnetobacterium casensis]